MSNNICCTVDKSCSFPRSQSHHRHKSMLQLLPPPRPQDFDVLDILGSHSSTSSRNLYVVVATDFYTKVTWVNLSSMTTSTHFVKIFFDRRIISYGIYPFFHTDSGIQILVNSFAALCGFLGVKHLAVTTYLLQKNIQAKRFDKTVVVPLHRCAAKHQLDWENLVRRLTHA